MPGPTRYSRQRDIIPISLGLDEINVTDVEVTSRIIDVVGYTTLTLAYNLTHTTATTIVTEVDTRPHESFDWAPLQENKHIGDFRFKLDLADHKVVLGDDTWSSVFDVEGKHARVRITGVNGSTDTLRVFATLSIRSDQVPSAVSITTADNVSVNGVGADDVNLSNTTPASPAGGVNVTWQKDGATPNNVSAHLPANSVSNTVLSDVATGTFKARNTAGTGDPEDVTIATAKTMLDLAGSNTGDQTITLTGDVTGSGTGSFTATIADNAVTYAKMQDVSAASRLVGRGSAAGAGDPEEISLGTNLSMAGTTLNATGGGGGDNISVNGVAATDADFDDTTPAPPVDGVNVRWQKDLLTPNNISANVPFASASQSGAVSTVAQAFEGQKTFNTSTRHVTIADPPSPPAGQGELYSRDRFGIDLPSWRNSAPFPLDLAQDNVVIVRNETGLSIPALRAVYESGSGAGGEILVSLAQSNSETTLPALGITIEAIPDLSNGHVMLLGILVGVNTLGFSVGDKVYVSATSPGVVTPVPPVHPNRRQVVGRALTSAASGSILINPRSPKGNSDDLGTVSNSWIIGDAAAGAKDLIFRNTNDMTLRGNPTATRVVTLPDATVGLAAIAGQLGGTPELPDVRGLRESGGTLMTIGAVADGQFTRRVGSTFVGGTPAGGSGNFGDAIVDFGALPGKSDASVAVTGQAGILAGSRVNAWLTVKSSADHTADEHWAESLQVYAGNIIAGTGFTIYAKNINPVVAARVPFKGNTGTIAPAATVPQGFQQPTRGGRGTLISGRWNVQWQWA